MTHVDAEIIGAAVAVLLALWDNARRAREAHVKLAERLTRLETLLGVVTKKLGLE